MGANKHPTTEVSGPNTQTGEHDWAVWINRNGAGYKLPFSLIANTEHDAIEKAEECVNRVLDGVGVSYRRDTNYSVEVRRIIE